VCAKSNACAVRSLWNVLDGLLWGVLNRTRLSDLLGQEEPLAVRLRHHVESTAAELMMVSPLMQLQEPTMAGLTVQKMKSGTN
jgi:hypothetical protein